jgi:hypothetical protein
MALKKSELYSSLWSSCDELRGGMDVSQYKDYVLVLLFIKYVSDKYAGQPFAPITIPSGACAPQKEIPSLVHRHASRLQLDCTRYHRHTCSERHSPSSLTCRTCCG